MIAPKETRCELCSETFASKTKMFKHLSAAHGYVPPNCKPDKVILLVGWVSDLLIDSNTWTSDIGTITTATDCGDGGSAMIQDQLPVDKVEDALFRAIYCLENGLDSPSSIPVDVLIARPRGTSRASSVVQRTSMLLSIEPSSHGLCDTFFLSVKRLPYDDNDWIRRINALLPNTVRVLYRYALGVSSSSNEFHAELSCSQRRFEYMIPYSVLNPTPSVPAQKILRCRVHHPSSKTADSSSKHTILGEIALESEDGQARVEFFRRLKEVLKCMSGGYNTTTTHPLTHQCTCMCAWNLVSLLCACCDMLRVGRKSYHNYATGGASPEDTVSFRRVDRVYHKKSLSIDGEDWVCYDML